jgi:hypothetical protein
MFCSVDATSTRHTTFITELRLSQLLNLLMKLKYFPNATNGVSVGINTHTHVSIAARQIIKILLQTSIYALPLMREAKFHTHSKQLVEL